MAYIFIVWFFVIYMNTNTYMYMNMYILQMSFKIVQTRESNGSKKLSVIPYLWEKNGQMHWPESSRQISQSKFNLMSHDANSVPPKDWPQYNCTVKRANLSYADAMSVLKEMSGQSDTAASDIEQMPPPLSVQKRNTARQLPSIANFREMVINVFD